MMLGSQLDVDGDEALRTAMQIAAANVAVLQAKLAEMDGASLDGGTLDLYRLQTEAVDRLGRWGKAAIGTTAQTRSKTCTSASPWRRASIASRPFQSGYPAERRRRSVPNELGRGLAVGSFHPGPRELRSVRIALEVVLIFRLRLPEGTGLADVGHDLAGPEA